MEDPLAQYVNMSEIHADDEFNCRGKILPLDVIDLAKDIQRKGLIQPITLMAYDLESFVKTGKKWKLIAGFRRHMAHVVMRKEQILATCRVQPMNDIDARLMNLAENLQRKELNIAQEAAALLPLFLAGLGENKVAQEIGMSRGWVQQRFLLLKLPDEIQDEFKTGKLKPAEIRNVYTVYNSSDKDLAKTYDFVKKLKKDRERGLTVKSTALPLTAETAKKKRIAKPTEIIKMILHLGASIGYDLHTRTLAWAAGEISIEDLFYDIKRYADKQGIEYTIPDIEKYNASES